MLDCEPSIDCTNIEHLISDSMWAIYSQSYVFYIVEIYFRLKVLIFFCAVISIKKVLRLAYALSVIRKSSVKPDIEIKKENNSNMFS